MKLLRWLAPLLLLSLTPVPPDSPNVLFVMVDDLNADLATYGHPMVQSPHLDRLAQRGLRFDRAYVQYPVCNPSRSSILTGLYPEQTGVLTNQAAFRTSLPDVSTLPQWFQQHGYHTARVGKIFHYNVPGHIGTDGQDDPASWDEVVNPIGIDKAVEDRIHTLQPGRFGGTLSWLAVDSDSAHTDDEGATAAIRLMESRHPDKTGKPLFLAVGFYRPHTPFVAPTSYFDRYPTDAIEPIMEAEEHRHDKPLAAMADRPRQLELDVETRREIIQAYYASITYMDAQLGRLLDALDTHGLADNTIVVFVSDHGYHLGRHGLWQKGDLYEGSVRVPLVIAMPDAQVANHSADALIEAVDLYPTLAELAGLPAAPHVAGRSFAPLLDDPNRRHRQAALSVAWSRAGWVNKDLGGVPILGHSIRTARFRYTEWAHGRHGVELYDYHTDPDEQTNLAGTPALARHEAALKVQLGTRRRASQPQ